MNELDFMQFPGMNFDAFDSPSSTLFNFPGTISAPDSGIDMLLPEVELSNDPMKACNLPAREQLMELVELFFDKLYNMFPCFHKNGFRSRVQDRSLEAEAPLVLLAVCCVTARYHPDPAIRRREKDWYEQARMAYELTQRRPKSGLRVLQAVILLVFHACTVGDFSGSWLFLGKAWRQAVVLGMNRVDADHAVAMALNRADNNAGNQASYGLENNETHTVVEREEYRRTLWLLFIMDRTHAWPTGWPHAITETQFKVDFPIVDSLFQAMDPISLTSSHVNTPFTRSVRYLGRLIDSVSSAKEPLNVFHYLAVAHVLLGRVAELIHSL